MTLRLNVSNRNLLMSHARVIIRQSHKMTEDHDKLYEKMVDMAVALVKAEYPESDLKVLAKYDMVFETSRCNFRYHDNSDVFDVCFNKRTGKKIMDRDEYSSIKIKVPQRHGGYNNKIYLASKELSEAMRQYNLEDTLYTKELNEKIEAYRQVINHAKTFEQLIEYWPEAAQLSEQLIDKLPVAISNEVIESIRAESLARIKAAEVAAKKAAKNLK